MPEPTYPCQVCGGFFPSDQLFDLKGNVPGGRKVTCRLCAAVLDEREACARVAETLPFREPQMDDCRSADIAAAIRARTEST